MTPNWLPQQNWMNVIPQARAGKSLGQGIAEGVGSIGTALISRQPAQTPTAPTPNLMPPANAPDIPIPEAPLPEYHPPLGSGDTYHPPLGTTDSMLLRKRPDILASMGVKTYGSQMA